MTTQSRVEGPVGRLPIIKRILLKAMQYALAPGANPDWHPLNRTLYVRSQRGRDMDEFYHPQVEVGDFTYGMRREMFRAYHPEDRVKIGRFCSIADGVRFIFGHHMTNRVSTFPFRAICLGGPPHADAVSKGDIRVGNDVWIGANAMILSGVEVGDGAVIAAGAVVSKSVPPYAVVGGVPASVIRFRLPREQVEQLLRIKWWDWPIDKVLANIQWFYGDVDEFILQHSGRQA